MEAVNKDTKETKKEAPKKTRKVVRTIPVALRNQCASFIEAMDWRAIPLRSPKKVYITAVSRGNFVFYVWFGDPAADADKLKASKDFLGEGFELHVCRNLKDTMSLVRKYEVEYANVTGDLAEAE